LEVEGVTFNFRNPHAEVVRERNDDQDEQQANTRKKMLSP
jgi:hypothetical protein